MNASSARGICESSLVLISSELGARPDDVSCYMLLLSLPPLRSVLIARVALFSMVGIISMQAGGLSATALSKGDELSRVVRFFPFLQ